MRSVVAIYYTPTFQKNFHRLPKPIKEKAYQKEPIFIVNPFDPRLKTHKLTGQLNQYWSFSIDYHWRIVFRFIKPKVALFVDVGTHEIYKM